jgi:hypothetical protein
MSIQASFTLRGRNPDVLTCIANLSNDEVFTPPEFANRMLDRDIGSWGHTGFPTEILYVPSFSAPSGTARKTRGRAAE